MPTLTKITEGEIVWSTPNSAEFSLHRWQGIFGFGSPYTVVGAACRGGVNIEDVFGRYESIPDERLIRVEDFPRLIKGFQRTETRPDGLHFHPWSLKVDPDADVFEVERSDGSILRFERECEEGDGDLW